MGLPNFPKPLGKALFTFYKLEESGTMAEE